MRAAVAFAVPDGASRFVSEWSSTISARGKHLRRLLREPHHQHRAVREVRRVEARHAGLARRGVDGIEIEAGRADDDGHAGCEARLDVRDDGVGAREVDRRVASVRPGRARVDHVVPGLGERRREQRADLPGRAVQRDPHQAALLERAPG